MERGRRFITAVLTGPYFRRSFLDAHTSPFFQVRTFVNGTLYSLLSRPKFRQAARQVDLAALLKAVAKRSDDTCARQIGHVLTQIQSTADGPDVSDSEGSSEGELLRPKVRSRWKPRSARKKTFHSSPPLWPLARNVDSDTDYCAGSRVSTTYVATSGLH